MPRQGVTPFPSVCPMNTGELHVTKLLFAFLLLVCHDSRRVEGPLSRDAQHTLVTIPTTKMLPELVESPLASPVHTGGGSEVGALQIPHGLGDGRGDERLGRNSLRSQLLFCAWHCASPQG